MHANLHSDFCCFEIVNAICNSKHIIVLTSSNTMSVRLYFVLKYFPFTCTAPHTSLRATPLITTQFTGFLRWRYNRGRLCMERTQRHSEFCQQVRCYRSLGTAAPSEKSNMDLSLVLKKFIWNARILRLYKE